MASTNTPELKVILCGEYGVGKTSILRLVNCAINSLSPISLHQRRSENSNWSPHSRRRFTNDTFVDNTNKSSFENRKSTLGLDFYSKRFEIEGLRPIKLCLWWVAVSRLKVRLDSIEWFELGHRESHTILIMKSICYTQGHRWFGKNSIGDFELLQVQRGCPAGVQSQLDRLVSLFNSASSGDFKSGGERADLPRGKQVRPLATRSVRRGHRIVLRTISKVWRSF